MTWILAFAFYLQEDPRPPLDPPSFEFSGQGRALVTVRTKRLQHDGGDVRCEYLSGGAARLRAGRFDFSLGYAQGALRRRRGVGSMPLPEPPDEPAPKRVMGPAFPFDSDPEPEPIRIIQPDPASHPTRSDGAVHIAHFDAAVTLIRAVVSVFHLEAGVATSVEYIHLDLHSSDASGFVASTGPVLRAVLVMPEKAELFVEAGYSWGLALHGDIEEAEGATIMIGATFTD